MEISFPEYYHIVIEFRGESPMRRFRDIFKHNIKVLFDRKYVNYIFGIVEDGSL